MRALTGKQAPLSVRSNMLTRERDLAAGVSSAPTMSGHAVFDVGALRITPTRMPTDRAVSRRSSSRAIPLW
jgi:hypothetical protein